MTKIIHTKQTPYNPLGTTMIRKKIGHDITRYGVAEFGRTEYGAPVITGLEHWGVYQMRLCHEGKIPIKMKFASTYGDKKTYRQQENRANYAAAVAAWQALTEEEKQEYRQQAKYGIRSGYNNFVAEFMLAISAAINIYGFDEYGTN